MVSLTQNNKIAIGAIAMFIISFASMVFFLDGGNNASHGNANLLGAGTHKEDSANIPHLDLADETQFRSYLGDTKEPIIVLDGEGLIKYASDDMCKLLSLSCSDFVGSLFFNYINTKDLPTLVADHLRLMSGNVDAIESLGPYRMIRKDKEVLVLFKGIHLETEGTHSIIISVQDLTEQAEGLNKPSTKQIEENTIDSHWIEEIYPNIKEKKDNGDVQLVVDKITYKE